jgi:hypothetical protein
MNSKYFLYALVVTVISTGVNWSSMLGSSSSGGGGSGWSSRGGSGYSGGGGGGHK